MTNSINKVEAKERLDAAFSRSNIVSEKLLKKIDDSNGHLRHALCTSRDDCKHKH